MENTFHIYSISEYGTATKFCTCHDSVAVVACAKFCSDQYITIGIAAEIKFQSGLDYDRTIVSEMYPSATMTRKPSIMDRPHGMSASLCPGPCLVTDTWALSTTIYDIRK